ncbi:MAG TPA: site-2 protease family protein [Pirellulales bacterium]|nr:site-2 protease family protein [Pirellulales bacterium]
MAATQQGAMRLFRFAGIDVFVHYSWLLVALFELGNRPNDYQNSVWHVIEYLSLFAIVTLHEFGHALACRQVGGVANRIMLWPLGGVAFVQPPPRPGALLWSIVAGPLVNVVLVPITVVAYFGAIAAGLDQTSDGARYLFNMLCINAGLLFFNMLPIYPLDGGQTLQALLWFVIGRARSLLVVSSIGLVVGALLVGVCLLAQQYWLALISLFIAWRGVAGFRQGRALSRMMRAERHGQFACPVCGASPPAGEYWACGRCRTRFDTFSHLGNCPGCGGQSLDTQCVHCHSRRPLTEWMTGRAAPAPVIDASLVERGPGSENPYASPHDSG